MKWMKVLENSLLYCETDQNTKETTTTTPMTTTDRLEALINNAIAQGQGQVVTEFQMPTTPPPTKFQVPTAAVYVRRLKNLYCDVPVFVYRIIACMKGRNFLNCPNFNATNEECENRARMMNKCGNELNYNNWKICCVY